jgi:hypothetical protein
MFLAKHRASLRLVSEGMNSRREVFCFQWAFCEFFRRRKERKEELLAADEHRYVNSYPRSSAFIGG